MYKAIANKFISPDMEQFYILSSKVMVPPHSSGHLNHNARILTTIDVGDAVHLWTLSLFTPDVFLLERVYKAFISNDVTKDFLYWIY